jgi:hypothetical protein
MEKPDLARIKSMIIEREEMNDHLINYLSVVNRLIDQEKRQEHTKDLKFNKKAKNYRSVP